MRVDTRIGSDPSKAAHRAAQLEAAGFDGVWISETVHDPFLGLAIAADRTERVTLGTSIAIAFARNPMTTAYLGSGLQMLSGGRFNLGLASLIKPHITRRFSMPWSRPAARMEEYIGALHAIWDHWEHGRKLEFRGDFYQHTFTNPMFTPPPHSHGRPKVHLGAIGPLMTRVAGRVADGLLCHTLATAAYLRDIALPALREAQDSAGRSADSLEISAFPFVVAAETPESFEAQARQVRLRIANGASTPAYRRILEHHGWGEAQSELLALTRRGRWADMPDVIDDEMLHTIAAVGTPLQVADILLGRYRDLADRLIITTPFATGGDEPEALSSDWTNLLGILRCKLNRPGGQTPTPHQPPHDCM